MPEPAFGFIARNEFQFKQVERLWQAYPQSKVLLVGNATDWNAFLETIPFANRGRFLVLTYREAVALDGTFDVLFFQTPFPLIEEIKRTRLVCVQYGLAKERHNYGEWHSLADMNLMYGDYSAAAVAHFSPGYAVGNLKFAGWNVCLDESEKKRAAEILGLQTDRPTILYMPTYDELGSLMRLLEPLSQLSERYNIVVKAHHNQERNGNTSWKSTAQKFGLSYLFGASSNQQQLLDASDVVISDFSGAIFDALYAQVPVVLYQEDASRAVGIQKFNLQSIEYRRRDELGIVCEKAEDLADCIDRALHLQDGDRERLKALRSELMVDCSKVDVVALAQSKVADLLEGRVPPLTTSQSYVRELVKLARSGERQLRSAQKKNSRRLLSISTWWAMLKRLRP